MSVSGNPCAGGGHPSCREVFRDNLNWYIEFSKITKKDYIEKYFKFLGCRREKINSSVPRSEKGCPTLSYVFNSQMILKEFEHYVFIFEVLNNFLLSEGVNVFRCFNRKGNTFLLTFVDSIKKYSCFCLVFLCLLCSRDP